MGPKRDHFLDVTVVMAFCMLCVVSGQKPEVRAQIGGVVEMDCRLPPPPTGVSAHLHVVEWVRQGLDIPVLIKFGAYVPRVHPQYEGRVSLMRNSVLRVEGLLLEDQGLYECRILLLDKATDETRNGTRTWLSVTAPPVFTKTPPTVVEAVVGNTLTLACVARGNPAPTITWAKDGMLIGGENAEVQSGTLSFKAVSIEAKGQYECLASNTEGNVTHVTKLDIKGPPVIVIPPEDTTLNMTQNALLRCQAVADPPNMTYVWQRQGENVYHIEALKSRVKIMVDGTLLITRIMPDDSGNYTCMPTNGLLTPPTASANLTVRHPAQVLQMPPQTYLPTGLGGLVSCPVRAQPPLLRIDWIKDGQPLDLEMYPGWSMTAEGSVFMATVNDDATGVYTCTPYNSYGTMGQSGPTTVILQDPPSLSESPNKEYRQEVGRMLVIPCQTTGDPTASITWSKEGPGPHPPYSVAANGSLLLPSLSKVHQGEWMCSVTNRVATATASTLISVLGTSPHAATRLSVSPGATQANVSWEPGFDGGYTQKFTVWLKQVSLGESEEKQEWLSLPVPSASGYSLQVTGLIPATEYQFSVLPHNKVGTGPFSEMASFRTLNPLLRIAKLEPPRSLSANQSSAGIVLQWSPVSQYPPVSGFVLQMRGEQGEWLNLDENIGANRSVMIVSGLSKDSAYTLRLLSRRGELLSEPSPSVNVSTTGMDMYPASARLLDNVPESLLAGVIGGVVILCLVLILVVGSFCAINQRRRQHHSRKKNDLIHPVIYISPPSTSPDSMLKQKLLPPQSHCPGSTPTSSCTASCSSSQSDHSSFGRPSRYQDRRQHLLSCPPHAPDFSRHHLPGTFTCHTPTVELISRGPDGRFMVQPYDQSSHTMRSLRKDFPQSTGVQRSMSLRSEKSVRREPPFVLSVELPPCTDPNPTTRVQAMSKHLSIHGRFYLDGEQDSCNKHPDESSLYSECNSDMYPQSSLEEGIPGYRSLKRAVQPETASNLVLQMEHERETGNLSRCLKLAQEREQLERELRKYTLERNAHVDENQERSGRDEENWRDTEQCDPIWKAKDTTSSQSYAQANRGRCDMATGTSSLSYVQWEDSPLISATSPVPTHPSERTRGHCDSPLTQHAPLSAVTHCPLRTDSVECHHPLGPPEGNDIVRVNTHKAGIYHEPHMSAELKRDEFELPERNKNNRCPFSGSRSQTSKPEVTINKVPDSCVIVSTRLRPQKESSENKLLTVTDCVEMSVDEPEDEVSVVSPTYPTMQRRHAHSVYSESLLAENNHRGHPLDARTSRPQSRSPGTMQPLRPVLRKAVSLGGCQKRRHSQRSQSLDSRTQSQDNFLTPDAWIHSLSQENCSSPYSFRSDRDPMSHIYAHPTESLPTCPTPPSPATQDPEPPTKENTHIPKSREPVLEREQQFSPPPTPVLSSPDPASHVPNKNTSNVSDASKWPITYQEALRSVQRMEARKNTSLPRDPGTTPPSLQRGYSWPAPKHLPQPPNQKKDTEVEGAEGRYGGHEAEMGRYHHGMPDSGGSYSSCASQSSGRGSLEPPNGRFSICLSPTPSSTPGTIDEIEGHTQETRPPDMELLKSRKASVDENYEWDSTDVSIQPGERDLEGRGVFSVGLQKYSPNVNHSKEGLKDSVHLPGHHHLISRYSETEPETVLF